MELVRKMFAGVQPSYLFKSYFFSAILAFLFFSGIGSDAPFFAYLYGILCTLLYPFATVVWDDLTGTLMGNTILVLPIPILLIWKLFKLLMLFILTPLIAPIGFIYIYFSNGYHKQQ